MRVFLLLASVALTSCAAAPAVDYTYTAPEQLEQCWAVGSLASRSLSGLSEVMEPILDQSYPGIEGLLIVKDGVLVVEEYFGGFSRTDKHQMRSITKSVASLLTGIAIQQGMLSSVDQRVATVLPELATEQNWDDRKRRITVEHLLTMTSGFKGNDWRDKHADSTATIASSDWVRFAAAVPVVAEPGERFAYHGASLMVLSAVLEKVSGMPLPQFADEYLFGPLGVDDATWISSSTRGTYLGSGLRITPRDLAKIGQLILNRGRWHDEQIVSDSWLTASMQRNKSFWRPRRWYGYLWWSTYFGWFRSVDVYFASGLGGQKLFIVPERSLVVVLTAGNYKNSGARRMDSYRIMADILDMFPAR